MPPPCGAPRWCAFSLVNFYCDVVLPALDEDVRRCLLGRYRRRRRARASPPAAPILEYGPTPSVAEYRRGALTADALYDGGVDEVPFLDGHFSVHTTLYYSAGCVRTALVALAPCARLRPPTTLSPSHTPTLPPSCDWT